MGGFSPIPEAEIPKLGIEGLSMEVLGIIIIERDTIVHLGISTIIDLDTIEIMIILKVPQSIHPIALHLCVMMDRMRCIEIHILI